MIIDSCLEQLHKFGFPSFQNKSKPSKRALNDRMPHLTPLSIAQLLMRDRKKVKQSTESFEETINKKNFEPEDDKPKLEFGSEYRDVSADDEMEAEEFHQYPAARLPFLVPKVPKGTYDRRCFSYFTANVWYGLFPHQYWFLITSLPCNLPTYHALFSKCIKQLVFNCRTNSWATIPSYIEKWSRCPQC